jgi:hemoglobin
VQLLVVGLRACLCPKQPKRSINVSADTTRSRGLSTAFPRVAMNPQLTHLFRGHSVESQRRQRQLIVDALCEATGGPCFYIGRDMKPVHVGLGITDEQWSTFMTIISTTAAERKFGDAERREFLALFAQRFRADVVEAR